MKNVIVYFLFFILNYACIAQVKPFIEFKKEVRALWKEKNYHRAFEFLNYAKEHYKEDSEQHTIIYYLGLLYLETNIPEGSFAILERGLEKGYFFSFWEVHQKQLASYPKGKKILELNKKNATSYFEKASIEYKIILPKDYDTEKKYPIVYFFHGNNSNLISLEKLWKNVPVSKNVIIALMQSPFPRSNYTFDWKDNIRLDKKFKGLHKTMLTKYAIDSSKVIMSGFSNGGRMAINLFLDQSFPSIGFIAFNPSKKLREKDVPLFQLKKGKGVVVTGDKDYMIERQRDLQSHLKKIKFGHSFFEIPNHGHDYPKDFKTYINKSIKFILEE